MLVKCLERAFNASKVLAKDIFIACYLLATALSASRSFKVLGIALSAC